MKHIKTIIPYLFWLLVLAFLVLYLRTIDYAMLSNTTFEWGLVTAALVVSIGARYWGANVWLIILRSLGAENIRYSRELVHVYAKSWLGRYIPGTAPWILGKIYFAAQKGVSKQKLAVGSLLEAMLQVLTQLIIALCLILLGTGATISDPFIGAIVIVSLVVFSVLLIPRVFNFFLQKAYRMVRKKDFPSEHLATFTVIKRGFLLYLITAAEAGVVLYLTSVAIGLPVEATDLTYLIGATTLAGAVGMLAIFVPSGIGVREGVLIALLAPVIGVENAVVVTIATRIISVITDLLFYVFSVIAIRFKK